MTGTAESFEARIDPSEYVARILALDEVERKEALLRMLLENFDTPYEVRRERVEHMLGLPWSEFKKVCVVRNGVLQRLPSAQQMEIMKRHLPLLRELDPGLASRDFHYVREFRRSLSPPEVSRLDAIARDAGVQDEVCR